MTWRLYLIAMETKTTYLQVVKMKTLRIILALLLIGFSQLGIASVTVLQQTLNANEIMTDVRNDANLWQGYLHRNNQEKVVFHALIDDGKITWWHEESVGNDTDYSEKGQLADSGTTVMGMLAGAGEMNPLGIFVLPAKYMMNKHAESLEYAQCKEAKGAMGASGYGAAASNTVSLLTGTFGPLSTIVGMIVANATYEKSLEAAYCELWVGAVVEDQIDSLMLSENTTKLDHLMVDASSDIDPDEYEL